MSESTVGSLEFKELGGFWQCQRCGGAYKPFEFGLDSAHSCLREIAAPARVLPKKDLKPPAPNPFSKKPPMHALPLDKLGGLSRALCNGDLKYQVRNWVGTAKDPALYIGAALRHLAAIQAGQMIDEHEPDCPPDCDKHSLLPHVNHLQACAVILEEALRNSGELVLDFTE